jgi:hypothetical protein
MSKIALEGNVSGSGTLTIAAPNTNSNFTLTLPTNSGTIITGTLPDGDLVGTTATQTLTNKSIVATQLTGTIAAARLPAGSVVQVVSTTKTNAFSTAGSTGTFVDITGLSVSITPSSASNKILIIAHSTVAAASGGNRAGFRIVRDSTAICVGDANGSRTRSTIGGQQSAANSEQDAVAFNFLDSPNTTSAITYKIQLCGENGSTYYVNEGGNASTTADQYTSTSTITVMEIAA